MLPLERDPGTLGTRNKARRRARVGFFLSVCRKQNIKVRESAFTCRRKRGQKERVIERIEYRAHVPSCGGKERRKKDAHASERGRVPFASALFGVTTTRRWKPRFISSHTPTPCHLLPHSTSCRLLMCCVLNTILAGQCVPLVFAPPVSRQAGLPPFPVKRPCPCPTTILALFLSRAQVGEFIVSFGRSEYQTSHTQVCSKPSRRTGGVRGYVWRVSPENHERDVTSSRAAGSKF